MRPKISIYILLICLLSSSYGKTNTPDDHHVNSFSHLYFELKNGLMIIDASVNDVRGKYIFDTGLEGIILDGEAQKTDQIFATIIGSVNAQKVNIKQIKIGNLIKNELTAFQSDLTNLSNFLQTQIKGMIGLSVLKEMLISIDYNSQTLKLIPKVSTFDQVLKNKRSMDIIMQSDVPCISLDVNGKPLLFALDTGAGIHFIDDDIIGFQTQISNHTTITSLGGESQGMEATTLSLSASKIEVDLEFLIINLDEINNQLEIPINGILSAKYLFEDQIFIDTSEKLLYY